MVASDPTESIADQDWYIPTEDVEIDKNNSLGRGGFGEVYCGYYATHLVAIKTITGVLDAQSIQDMYAEAALWYSLRHPYIVTLFGVTKDVNHNPLLVIERMQSSLYQRIYANQPAMPNQKLFWLLQIAQAFKCLHARKNPIIHADLCPHNILIGHDNIARVTDFGLSRCQTLSKTYAGQGYGMIRFAPPESFARRYHADKPHDVYSFGMTMFEVLAEIRPFNDTLNEFSIPAFVMAGERPDSEPDKIPDDSWQWRLIQRCWKQEPSQRPTFAEIVEELQQHSIGSQQLLPLLPPNSAEPLLESPFDVAERYYQQAKVHMPNRRSESCMKAFDMYMMAAEFGHIAAQQAVGHCYEFGLGVEKNTVMAFNWYVKAAEKGNSEAQNSLGQCFEHGTGVAVNPILSVHWYRKAAFKNHSSAQCNLAACFFKGIGVDEDLNQAFLLYEKSAIQGNSKAETALGNCYGQGYGVSVNLPLAVYWHRKSANQNNPWGQCNLAICYFKGLGVEKDLSQAAILYEKSANQGNANAQTSLGNCYGYGYGVSATFGC
ncbi:UNVERIFIED_CONTAM: hypothetical protein HDU68_010734 [Siphonaria sp. JEL0065]|nr:hypothetical protein HDU68_010734 [Siphonaria sp. JEL0065]